MAGLWQQRWTSQRLEIRVETYQLLNVHKDEELEAAVARWGDRGDAECALTGSRRRPPLL